MVFELLTVERAGRRTNLLIASDVVMQLRRIARENNELNF